MNPQIRNMYKTSTFKLLILKFCILLVDVAWKIKLFENLLSNITGQGLLEFCGRMMEFAFLMAINLFAPELFFLILAHPVYKM